MPAHISSSVAVHPKPKPATNPSRPKRPAVALGTPAQRRGWEPSNAPARVTPGASGKSPTKMSERDLIDERFKLAMKLSNVRTAEGETRLAALDKEIRKRGGYARLRAGAED